jgi:hypothetical protein
MDPTWMQTRFATESLAEVAVGGPPAEGDSPWIVYGPFCERARTLPTVYRGTPGLGRDGPSATFTLPDPCYWSPELPFRYQLRPSRDAAETGRQPDAAAWFGLVRREAHRGDLRCEGRRTVLRGVGAAQLDPSLLEQAAAADSALWTADVRPQGLDDASRRGVPLVIDLAAAGAGWETALCALSWRPAAVVVVLDEGQLAALPAWLQRPRSLLLAQRVAAGDAPAGLRLHPEADAAAWESVGGGALRPGLAACRRPVLVTRRRAGAAGLPEARSQCDVLQAELVREIDCAGYFLLPAAGPSG